jgi:hypothetical protein
MQTHALDHWYNHLGFYYVPEEYGFIGWWEWHGYGFSEFVPLGVVATFYYLMLGCAGAFLVTSLAAPRASRVLVRCATWAGVLSIVSSILSVDEVSDSEEWIAWWFTVPVLLMAWIADPARTHARRMQRTALFSVLILINPHWWLLWMEAEFAWYELLQLAAISSLTAIVWIVPKDLDRLRSLGRVLAPLPLLPFVINEIVHSFHSSSLANEWDWLFMGPLTIPVAWIWIAACLHQRTQASTSKMAVPA